MGSKVLERTKYIGGVHNLVHCVGECVRGLLQQLWGTKSAVILQWIKTMIHKLYPHPVAAAALSTARQKKGWHKNMDQKFCTGLHMDGLHCHATLKVHFMVEYIHFRMHLWIYVHIHVLWCAF